jgi:hypothetical protein
VHKSGILVMQNQLYLLSSVSLSRERSIHNLQTQNNFQ